MEQTYPPSADDGPHGDAPLLSLPWSPAPKIADTFTGIDFNDPGSANGLDPYLVWSDLSGFAHLAKVGQNTRAYLPTALPVLLELQEGVSAANLLEFLQQSAVTSPKSQAQYGQKPDVPLRIEGAFLQENNLVRGGVIPATLTSSLFNGGSTPKGLERFLRRIEIDLPQDATLKTLMPLASSPPPVSGRPLLTGKVMALIDDGCAFAHSHMVTRSAPASLPETRVKRLWDMNVRGPLATVGAPVAFSVEAYPGQNGRDYSDVELNALIASHTHAGRVDEDGVYAAFSAGTLDRVNRLQGRVAHGPHVMDLACGPYFVQDTMSTRTGAEPANPTWEPGADDASDAQIIFVQLPMNTVQDTSGRNTMTQDVIKAFTYILSQCDESAQIVVNLSWGALAGPHDGSHVLERYMDTLIQHERATHPMPLGQNRLQVTVPVGNGYQSRTHANFKLKPGRHQTMHWRTEPDDATESYMEIWLPKKMEVAVDIVDPFGNVFPAVMLGDVRHLAGYKASLLPGSVLGVCYNDALLAGEKGHLVLLALAPTVSPDNTRVTAPHGLWTVRVTNVSAKAGVVDAYIERDDVALNTRRGARQSYFEDRHYDHAAVDDNTTADLEIKHPERAYVRREGVFNNIATGKRTVKAGGVRETDLEIAEYSPHHFYTSRPKRPHTATPVDFYATTEESRTLHGVRAAGTRSGGTVRLSGTSTAAPQIARDLFNEITP